MLSDPFLFSTETRRVFRTDKSYAVTSGKWYFEFEIVTAGEMRVGWARAGCDPEKELGSDDQAFVFDGSEVRYKTDLCIYLIKSQHQFKGGKMYLNLSDMLVQSHLQ